MSYITFNHRPFWAILLITCVAMMAVALFYQYSLGHEPCVLCVHIRAWVIALGLISAAALIIPSAGFRVVSFLASIGVIGMFGENVTDLWLIETGRKMGSCSWSAGFPDYLPLNEWAPFLFEIGGICGQSPEMLLGITMAESLLGVSLFMVAMFLVSLSFTIYPGIKVR